MIVPKGGISGYFAVEQSHQEPGEYQDAKSNMQPGGGVAILEDDILTEGVEVVEDDVSVEGGLARGSAVLVVAVSSCTLVTVAVESDVESDE